MLEVMQRIVNDFQSRLPDLDLRPLEPSAFAAAAPEGWGYPLYASPNSGSVLVDREGLVRLVDEEESRLHRPLVEGMILAEVLYLIGAKEGAENPRLEADELLTRHWPLQYVVLRELRLRLLLHDVLPAEAEGEEGE
jgi:hypothetical protein